MNAHVLDWSTACQDWDKRLLAGKPPIPDLPIFEAEADQAIKIFKKLRCPDIEGFPEYGEICDVWVLAIIRVIFGSYDVKLKRRMIREFFLLIPKKNGKSSIAAAIMVTAVLLNKRPEAEALLIAPTKKIAEIAFKQAHGIIKLSTTLSKLFLPQAHQKTITHRITNAVIVIKAADTDVITGSKATFILIDETHVFAKSVKAADVFVEIRGSLASRPDGFLLQITTQSKEQPSGVFKSELEMAREARDGKINLPLLAITYELPDYLNKGDEWQDEKYWPIVNPNFGRSVDPQFLRDELTKAQRLGKPQLALLASQHFNKQIGLKMASDRWAGADFWEAAAVTYLKDLDDLLNRSDVVVIGIDGGGLDDLLGLCVMGRDKKTEKWLVWCRAWAHEIVKERRNDIVTKLEDFAKEKTLTFVGKPGEDVMAVCDIVMRCEERGLLAEKEAIAVDRIGIADIFNELTSEERGIEPDRIVGIDQGFRLNGAIKTTERRIAGGELVHDGSELMKWCVGNAKAEPRGNAISINKQISGSAKIDPLMAVFNATSLMGRNPESAGSAYEDEDVLI